MSAPRNSTEGFALHPPLRSERRRFGFTMTRRQTLRKRGFEAPSPVPTAAELWGGAGAPLFHCGKQASGCGATRNRQGLGGNQVVAATCSCCTLVAPALTLSHPEEPSRSKEVLHLEQSAGRRVGVTDLSSAPRVCPNGVSAPPPDFPDTARAQPSPMSTVQVSTTC